MAGAADDGRRGWALTCRALVSGMCCLTRPSSCQPSARLSSAPPSSRLLLILPKPLCSLPELCTDPAAALRQQAGYPACVGCPLSVWLPPHPSQPRAPCVGGQFSPVPGRVLPCSPSRAAPAHDVGQPDPRWQALHTQEGCGE